MRAGLSKNSGKFRLAVLPSCRWKDLHGADMLDDGLCCSKRIGGSAVMEQCCRWTSRVASISVKDLQGVRKRPETF